MQLEVFEVFENFTKQDSRAAKIEYLRKMCNEIPAVKDVCLGTFSDKIEFAFPDGKPPYTPNKEQSVPSSLRRLHKQFGDFVAGSNRFKKLGQVRAEMRFIQMLESIHADDALIVIDMINKKSPVKGLTKKIVEEAFPNLL
jgi:hypothetical protein